MGITVTVYHPELTKEQAENILFAAFHQLYEYGLDPTKSTGGYVLDDEEDEGPTLLEQDMDSGSKFNRSEGNPAAEGFLEEFRDLEAASDHDFNDFIKRMESPDGEENIG